MARANQTVIRTHEGDAVVTFDGPGDYNWFVSLPDSVNQRNRIFTTGAASTKSRAILDAGIAIGKAHARQQALLTLRGSSVEVLP